MFSASGWVGSRKACIIYARTAVKSLLLSINLSWSNHSMLCKDMKIQVPMQGRVASAAP